MSISLDNYPLRFKISLMIGNSFLSAVSSPKSRAKRYLLLGGIGFLIVFIIGFNVFMFIRQQRASPKPSYIQQLTPFVFDPPFVHPLTTFNFAQTPNPNIFVKKIIEGRLYLTMDDNQFFVDLPEKIFLICNPDVLILFVDYSRLDLSTLSPNAYLTREKLAEKVSSNTRVILLYQPEGEGYVFRGIISSKCSIDE